MQQNFSLINSAWINQNIDILIKKKVVIITGAGISVSSGIPDFRSKQGLFTTIKNKHKTDGKDLFNHRFGFEPKTRPIYYKFISELRGMTLLALPSPTHIFLNKYKKYHTKYRIYTQNIDSLEERAGISLESLVHLHGDLKTLVCIMCGHRIEYTEKENIIFSKGEEITCTSCVLNNKKRKENGIRQTRVGFYHTNIIHYDQPHYDGYKIARMFESDMDLDLFIVIGTSLKVHGIKEMVKRGLRKVRSNNGKGIYVNLEEPSKEFREMFDFFWKGDCDTFCEEILKNIEILRIDQRLSILNIKNENKNVSRCRTKGRYGIDSKVQESKSKDMTYSRKEKEVNNYEKRISEEKENNIEKEINDLKQTIYNEDSNKNANMAAKKCEKRLEDEYKEIKETKGLDIKGKTKETIGSDIKGKTKETIGLDIKGKTKETIGSDIKGKTKETIGSDIKGKTKETKGLDIKSEIKAKEHINEKFDLKTKGKKYDRKVKLKENQDIKVKEDLSYIDKKDNIEEEEIQERREYENQEHHYSKIKYQKDVKSTKGENFIKLKSKILNDIERVVMNNLINEKEKTYSKLPKDFKDTTREVLHIKCQKIETNAEEKLKNILDSNRKQKTEVIQNENFVFCINKNKDIDNSEKKGTVVKKKGKKGNKTKK